MGLRFSSIFVAMIVLVIALAAGCNRGGTAPTSTSRDKPSAPKYPERVTVTFAPTNDPKKDLDDAIRRLETAYPYRVTYSQTSGGQPVQFVVEYVAADKFHLRDSSGGETFKMGGTAYSRYPNPPSSGEWITDNGGNSIGEQQERTVVRNLPLDSQSVKAAGQETLNGVSCYVLTYNKNFVYQTGKACIGADGLLYRIDELSKSFEQHYVFEYIDVQVHNPMR